MVTICAVPWCRNRGTIRFPKDPVLRQTWYSILRSRSHSKRIALLKPVKSHMICRAHFKKTDFLQSKMYKSGDSPNHQWFRLKPRAAPSIFVDPKQQTGFTEVIDPDSIEFPGPPIPTDTPPEIESRNSCIDPLEIRPVKTYLSRRRSKSRAEIPIDPLQIPTNEVDQVPICDPDLNVIKVEPKDVDIDINHEEMLNLTETSIPSIQSLPPSNRRQIFGIEKLQLRSDVIHYYTGFDNYNQLCDFSSQLGTDLDHVTNPLGQLSILDEFLLTVIKLRQNKDFFELGFLFGIDEFVAKAIFHSWLGFMFKQLQKADTWLGEYIVVPTFTPRQASYCKMQEKPTESNPLKYTVKVMLGINSKGLGSDTCGIKSSPISDQQLVLKTYSRATKNLKESNQCAKIKMEDEVKNSSPAKPKDNAHAPMVRSTNKGHKTSFLRSHIDKVVDLTRKFIIISQGLQSFNAEIGNQIVFVCFAICNFISYDQKKIKG